MLGVRRGLTPISQTICPASLTIAYPPHPHPCPPQALGWLTMLLPTTALKAGDGLGRLGGGVGRSLARRALLLLGRCGARSSRA